MITSENLFLFSNSENLLLLSQLVFTLEELSKKLEEFYEKKDINSYEKTKKEILNINYQISKILP
jgi:hypothetical protein